MGRATWRGTAGSTGFYLRVLREGVVQAGDEIVQVASGLEAMTVTEVDVLLYLPGHLRQQLLRALRIAPDPVDDPADGSALVCCSRPASDLVLDL